MKKSLRVISLVLSVVMILGSVSVAASAWGANGYTTYRTQNGAGLTFDDANQPVYSTDQYASMALDEVDRMLAEEQLIVDIYVGTLNLSSVDGTITSVNSLLDSVGNLLSLGLLGVAEDLTKATPAIANTKRANGDITVIWDLLDLIGGLFPIVTAYVNQDADLGILNGFVADYMFDVRELVFGLLYGLTGMGDVTNPDGTVTKYDYMESRTIPAKYQGTGTAKIFMQDVLNTLVLGKWQKLDDIFYEKGHKDSNIAYQEIVFRDGSANGPVVTGALDTTRYDYYGYVHEDRWVTNGLGDFIRVTEGASAPAASYTKVNFQSTASVYAFVEPILLHAYNNIAVPVLNRITKNWLREKCGYTFDVKYTELYTKDLPEYGGLTDAQIKENPALWDAEKEEYKINPDYDYLYGGAAPAELGGDAIFSIFDVEHLQIPTIASIPSNSTFIEELNRNLTDIIKVIIKGTYTVKRNGSAINEANRADGDVYTFTLSDSASPYSFNWTYGSNNLITDNICNVVKFVLQVTGQDFFDDILINKGEVYTPAEVGAMSNQQVVAYIIRSIINTNVNGIWIDGDKQSIIDVCLDALIQLAYLDLPQLTYTVPATTDAKIDKCLTILMDIAAYNLNAEMDTNLNSTSGAGSAYFTNNGLLPYQGDSGDYKVSVAILAAWAVSKWACADEYGGGNSLLNLSFGLDNFNGTTGGGAITADTFWADIDTLLNAIVPIKAGNPVHPGVRNDKTWLNADISGSSSSKLVVKDFLFDSVIDSVLDLNFAPILKLLTKNDNGALAEITLENALVDTIHRVFDLIFPDIFPNNVNEIDKVIVNSTLATVVSDLLVTLSATYNTSETSFINRFMGGQAYPSTNNGTIVGRGKIIAEIALPIVCMVLGLSDTQEFGKLENYVPTTISSSVATTQFQIYNGSSGVNTAYKNANNGYSTTVDQLYTYEIIGSTMNRIKNGQVTNNYGSLTGAATGTRIPAGSSVNCSISGYSAGDMLEIIYRYKVLDETGNYLSSVNDQGNTVATVLTSTSYAYVGETSEGDDEILVTNNVNGYAVQAPAHYYMTGGLSGLKNFAFRVKDNGDSVTKNIKVTNVTISGGGNRWVYLRDESDVPAAKRVTEGSLTGESDKSVAILTPFDIDDNAYRVAYETVKDADGNDTYVDGIAVKGARKALEAGEYYVEDGDYTITTTIQINGVAGNVQTKVHIYNDYGLPGYVDKAIAANRSSDTLKSGNNYALYYQALCEAAEFTLQPRSHGNASGGFVGSYIRVSGYDNKYEQLYRNLYRTIEGYENGGTHVKGIKEFETSAGAGAIWTAVEEVWPHDFQRKSFVYNLNGQNVTVYYKDYIEYNEAGYPYIGLRDYVGVPYRQFRSAVNNANSLIDREYKYLGCSKEDFDKLSAAEQTKAVQKYVEAVDNASTISSVDSIIAIHRLDLTNQRLISLGAGNRSKLQTVLARSQFNVSNTGFSASSYKAYSDARTFANAVAAKSDATNEECAKAIEKYLGTWKRLEEGADYTQVEACYNEAVAFLEEYGYGIDGNTGKIVVDIEGEAEWQPTYSKEGFRNYLYAVKKLETLIDDKNAGNDVSISDQDILDRAVAAVIRPVPPSPVGPHLKNFTEEPYDFTDSSAGLGYYTYNPVMNVEDLDTYGIYFIENENNPYYGEELDGVLYGVPVGFYPEDIIDMFVYDENLYQPEVTESKLGYGSGSYIVFYDPDDEANTFVYLIIFRGDINEDGYCDSTDIDDVWLWYNYAEGYDWEGADYADMYHFLALDVNGDLYGDIFDVDSIWMFLNYAADIMQDCGGIYTEE